jgi:hypothetical protein
MKTVRMRQGVVGQLVAILGLAGLATAAACGTDAADPCGAAARIPASVPVTAQVSLQPGEFQLLQDTAATGAVSFPAAGAGGAAWLVVGQLASSTAGECSTFAIGGQAFPPDIRGEAPGRTTIASRFHDLLRRRESDLARQAVLQRSVQRAAPPVRTPPPVPGAKRTFRVCASISCTTQRNVQATAQFVGTHAAIFVDDTVPGGGFTPADLAEIGGTFDSVIYPIDTDRFGAESDIDGNGRVLILLTPRINDLVTVPQCNTSFITGFFYGADITPGIASQYNNGEIFYGLVPDPAGSATRCPYSKAFVKRILPTTFIHEFQHMISFNQHVLLRGGSDEVLWLNEAMSHLAEELGGLHYDSLGNDTTSQRYFLGDLYNAYIWMRDPQNHAMVTEEPPGTLEERGAEWLFVRFIVDQFGPATTRAIVQTSLTGAANISAATGNTPFRTLLGRWALAVYLNGMPGFTAPSPVSYQTWNFRTTFATLHAQRPSEFPILDPLRPDSGVGGGVSVTGVLRAGSAAYIVSTQPASSSGFQLVFRGPDGGGVGVAGIPQLAIARIR